MNEDLKNILEIVADIQKHMAKRDDLTRLDRSLRREIADNAKAIARLSDGLRGQAGFTIVL